MIICLSLSLSVTPVTMQTIIDVGKSCMLMRLLENRFRSQHQPTLGVQFGSRMFNIRQKAIKLQVWDTAGQQSFKSITRAYYKGSIAAILVFDMTCQKSFQNIKNWLYEIKNHAHQKLQIVLVGNKKDLKSQRVISIEDATQFAKENKLMSYYEVSALSGQNVQEPFVQLMKDVLLQIQKGSINIQTDATYGIKAGPKQKQKLTSPNIELLKDCEKKKEVANKCSC